MLALICSLYWSTLLSLNECLMVSVDIKYCVYWMKSQKVTDSTRVIDLTKVDSFSQLHWKLLHCAPSPTSHSYVPTSFWSDHCGTVLAGGVCSIQTIGVCFIWLQLLCLVINKHVPLLTVKVLFGICQPFILLLVFNMGSLVCCTGWVANVLHTCSHVISEHVPWLTVKALCGIYQSFVLLLVFDMTSTLCCAGWAANVLCTCSHVICKQAPLLTVKALFGIH